MHVISTTRLTALALVAVALAALGGCAEMPGKEAEEPTRPRVFVANESSNTVTVVDGESFQVVGTVDARNHATHDLAVSRDGRFIPETADRNVSWNI